MSSLVADPAPLSHGQERMWLLDQFAEADAALNLVTAIRVRGKLHTSAVRDALDDIVRRHEVLRSSIVVRAGRPVQITGPHTAADVRLVELSRLEPQSAQQVQESLLTAEARRPFDLRSGPLFRFTLIVLGAEEHLLVVTLHHIATDAWSMGRLAEEFATHYRCSLAGRPAGLPPPAVQYAEFARAQRDAPPSRTAATTGWMDRLSLPAGETLPLDRPAGERRHAAAVWTTALPPSLVGRLHTLRDQDGGSLFMLVMAALTVVLHRLTGDRRVTVGTLSAGRTSRDIESTIGYFGNVLLVQADFTAEPAVPGGVRFRELWRRVREDCLVAFEHQHVPYESVVTHLRRGNDGASAPAAYVLYVHQQDDRVIELPGAVTESVPVPHPHAHHDLTVETVERDGVLHLTFQYDASVLTERTVMCLAGYLRATLMAVTVDPDVPCARVELEPHRVDAPAPVPAVAASGTLHGLFEAQAARTPDAVALVGGSGPSQQTLTYGALEAAANRLARRLVAAGVRPDDRVGVQLRRSPRAVVAMLAALKAGAAYVPLDPAYPAERLAYMVADSAPRCLLTSRELASSATPGTPVLLVDEDDGQRNSAALRLRISPDQTAYVMYTSGSTGPPKGVLGPHRGMVNRLTWMWDAHPYRLDERACHRAPLSFVDSVAEIFGPLLGGVPAHVFDDDAAGDPHRLVDALATAQTTRLLVVPSLLRMLLDVVPELDHRLPVLGCWTCSGERLPDELAQRFHRALPRRLLLNLYGSTEVAADVTATVVEPGEGGVSIGAPIPSVSAVVVDRAGTPVPRLGTGELLVGGAAVARGYHNRPGETAARFLPDTTTTTAPAGARVFRTGDLVRVRPDGNLVFVGRDDEQVQVGGVRVDPGEVEHALLGHPAVAQAAVVGRAAAANSVSLIGYVVLSKPCPVEQLLAYLRTVLPVHARVGAVVTLAALPMAPSGKIDRRALPDPGNLPPGAERAADLATGPYERLVADLFTELLPVPWRTVDDDFFLLGGQSILAAALVHRVREECGVALGLRDVFAAPSLAGLARHLAERDHSTDGPRATVDVVPNEEARFEPFPLTDVQQAYWVGRNPGLDLGNVATHAYFEVSVDRLDVPRLTEAIRTLIERHDALRTIIRPDGLQQVLPSVPAYQPAVTDLRSADPSTVKRMLAAVRDRMSHQVLPADTWPLFDLEATLLPGAGPDVLHVGVDALIADAHSVQLLMSEFGWLYHEPGTRLPSVDLTFRECVLARLERSSGPDRDTAWAYWMRRLPDLPGGPALPLRRSPSSVDSPHFQRWSHNLDGESWSRFRDMAARVGVTPSVALLSVFAEVLTRWSTHPHYSLMLTLFDRDLSHPHAGRVVGDFTSLTLLDVDHREPAPFATRARALQDRLWSDLDHRLVSGVEVAREAARLRGGRPGLAAPVVFTSNLGLEGTTGSGPPLGELRFAITQTPQLYLDHQVSESPDGLSLTWDAVAELFPQGLVDDAFTAYVTLLCRLAGGIEPWEEPVGALMPSGQREQRAVVNATAVPRSTSTLTELVTRFAAVDPHAPAVLSGSVRLTHGELLAYAARVAGGLQAAGVGRGDVVGVAMDKGWEQVVAVIAVVTTGAAYLPLDPALPTERLRLLCEQTRVREVLTQSALAGRLHMPSGVRLWAVDDLSAWTATAADVASRGPTPDDLAYVIFTSGSTDTPKGVMIDHAGAVNTIEAINRRFRVGRHDRALALSSLSFDLSVYDVFGVLAAGGALVLPAPGELRVPSRWLAAMDREGVTLWNSVPALMGLAVDAAEAGHRGLDTLRLVMLSGDWIPLDLPDRIRALAADAAVVGLGGATEASIWSVYHPVGPPDPQWTSVPYGRPLANQTVHVLDRDLEDRPDWVPGDLFIGGTGVALGYWDDPDRTAAAFLRHPVTGERLYRTGDLARFRSSGDLEFLGREDGQVKINGFRVELGEIEAALHTLPGVARAVVCAVGPDRGDRRLAAYYVPTGHQVNPAGIRAGLRAVLPDYLVPTTVTAVADLPLTGNGKVDRGGLAALAAIPATRSVSADLHAAGDVEPPEELVAALTEAWQVVLGVDLVAPGDNFFALGGTSLVALRLLAKLQSDLGVTIPLVRLYESPTVAELARAVAESRTGASPVSEPPAFVPDPAQRFAPFPLTSVQEAYWLGSRDGQWLGGVSTHSYVELDVVDLDVDRLERALRRLVDRHDALRTVLLPDGTQQALPDPPGYRVDRVDLRGAEPTVTGACLAAVRAELSHRRQDPYLWPLFVVRASLLGGGLTRLHIGLDLLIADALSFRILQRELLAVYENDDEESLPALRCTFRDHLMAVLRSREGAEHERARQYWRDRLPALPPPPALPLLSQAEDEPRFARLEGRLEPGEWLRLRSQAASRNLTLSALLAAAFADVLALWTQSGRFTLNVTTFNRLPLHPDVDHLVGDFTTTTLLAVDAAAGTFAERASALQARLFTDLDHRSVSGVEVLRMLRAVPGQRGRATAPVVFTSMLDDGAPFRGRGWDATVVYGISQTPQVLLDFQMYEHAGALVYNWDHLASRFPPGLLEAMFAAYGTLLRSLATDGAYFAAAPAWGP